jgi:hypothetical protein
MNELIIAAYHEDINWVNDIKDYKITIYNKSDREIENSIKLPNVGRETQTYFYHIVNNYDNLAEYTFFSQGSPHDHVRNFRWILDMFPNSSSEAKIVCGKDGYFFSNGHFMNALESESNGQPYHWNGLDIDGLWGELYTDPHPKKYMFTAGAIFCVSRDQIRTKDKSFYEKCLKLSVERGQAPWEFERMMQYIFDPNIK